MIGPDLDLNHLDLVVPLSRASPNLDQSLSLAGQNLTRLLNLTQLVLPRSL